MMQEKQIRKFKDAMQKINEGGLSKEEKEDLITAAKDALEDIISDENEKEIDYQKKDKREMKRRHKRDLKSLRRIILSRYLKN